MVTVASVAPRSRAERAGIHTGDVLVSINGRPINDVLDYRFYMPDAKLKLVVERDGKRL